VIDQAYEEWLLPDREQAQATQRIAILNADADRDPDSDPGTGDYSHTAWRRL
jgi:hypothetical protein